MSRSTEMVLFYTPDTTARTTRLKGIFVRLGIRIRNITAEQMGETIGYLQRTVKIDIFVFGAEGAAAYKTGPVCSMPASCTGVISISGRSFR